MDAKHPPLYFNRELSWLEFNQRVLEEAGNPKNPMLERLKFLAITASNLDEFFMVRVGGLYMARKAGRRRKDPAGMTPRAQLNEIYTRSHTMMNELHDCFSDVVSPALNHGNIRHALIEELTAEQLASLFDLFREELYPVITPIALQSGKNIPNLQNLSLNLLIRLQKKTSKDRTNCYAVLSMDRSGSRIVQLPAENGFEYVLRNHDWKHLSKQMIEKLNSLK